MKASPFLLAALVAATLCALTGGASAATARASGAPIIYAGPGNGYAPIGRLAPNEVVRLAECTPSGRWCRVLHNGPSGWVLGSYLIGSAAKVEATPYRPLVDPFRPLFRRPFHPF